MHTWLRIELVISALLVTSFTSVGIIALWAAISQRHWFVRAAMFLAVLSLPGFVRAWEPAVVFILQVAIVFSGAAIWLWRHQQRNSVSDPSASHTLCHLPPLRMSLSTLILVVAIISVAVAIATNVASNLPPQNFEAWSTLGLIGTLSGLAVLLGALLYCLSDRWWAWPIGIIASLLLSMPLVWFDWLVLSFTWLGDWPPDMDQVQRVTSTFGVGVIPKTARVWYGIVPSISALTCFVLLVAQPVPSVKSNFSRTNDSVRRVGTAAIVFLICLFPAYLFWRLLSPPRLPHITPLKPNGLNAIAAAGNKFGNSQILTFESDPKSTAELAAEVAKYRSAYEMLRLGLSQDVQAEVWPPISVRRLDADRFTAEIQNVRSAQRALSREADLALEKRRYANAANISLDIIRLGVKYGKAGLLRHLMLGLAIEQAGYFGLFQAIDHLNVAECRQLMNELMSLAEMHEPFVRVQDRDSTWEQNAYGWHHQAGWVLFDIVGTNSATYKRSRDDQFRQNQAFVRLLIAELAIRIFRFEHSVLPSSLDELVPEYLTAVPDDPFDLTGGKMKYRRPADGYVLYSNGPDEIDDGGAPLTLSLSYAEHGDLSVGGEFAPTQETSDGRTKNETEINEGSLQSPAAESPTATTADTSGRQPQ